MPEQYLITNRNDQYLGYLCGAFRWFDTADMAYVYSDREQAQHLADIHGGRLETRQPAETH